MLKVKVLQWIITKLEFRLSKKENKVGKKDKISKELSTYRDLLDIIDNYFYKDSILQLRHYRYFDIDIDLIEKESDE